MDRTPATKPLHQRVFIALCWLAGGLTAVGTLLDALSNSVQLLTPRATYVATLLLVTGWLSVTVYARKQGISWVSTGGRPVRIRRIGRAVHWSIAGVLLLLWVPRAADVLRRVPDGSAGRSTPAMRAPGLLDSLAKAGQTVVGADTVDMDGSGGSEILTLWWPTRRGVPGALEVFAGGDRAGASLLRIDRFREGCASHMEYRWLNMRGDSSRQLVVWRNGCAARGSLEVFAYRGFEYLERVAKLDLEEETVRIVGNQVVVLGSGRSRVCAWHVDRVRCEQERVDAGDQTIFVEYAHVREVDALRAFGASGVVSGSGDTIRLHRGQLLSLAPREGTEAPYREVFSSDGILESRPPFYYARAVGETRVFVENASGSGNFHIVVLPDAP